jgi:hypothetical protein
MERFIKISFLFGFLLFFVLLYFQPFRDLSIKLYHGLVWFSVLMLLSSFVASLFVLFNYLQKKDRKGALGIFITIIVFTILIALLAIYMTTPLEINAENDSVQMAPYSLIGKA